MFEWLRCPGSSSACRETLMDRFGREVIRRWKLESPCAYDSLRDPAAYFDHIDRHCRALVEEQARAHAERDHTRRDVRFWIDQCAQTLLESWPMPPREETFLDTFSDRCVDPRGRFVRDAMPHRPHPLWVHLEDPNVTATQFHRELRSWFETLPVVPWIEYVGPPDGLFEADSSGDLMRTGGLRQPEIRCWPSASVLTFRGADDLENAYQVMVNGVAEARSWASSGYVDRSERGLVLPPRRDDGSEPDMAELDTMTRDCGPLVRGTEYVVTNHHPHVVDFHAVSWHLSTDLRQRAVKPLLLLDVDGVLLREGAGEDALSPDVLSSLDRLGRHYELAWATSWESSANTLLDHSTGGSWPVVPVVSSARRDPDGFDNPRVKPVLDFVGDRPFAWVDDQLGRGDAKRLTADRDCLVLRPNPRHGLTDENIGTLLAWS